MHSVMTKQAASHKPDPKTDTGFRFGKPGDSFEHEADRAADTVIKGGNPSPTFSIATIGSPTPDNTDSLPQNNPGTSGYRERATRQISSVLSSPGKPLETGTRDYMESRFNRDFGHIRIHTNASASASAHAIGSAAYTSRNHVVFAGGQYQPETQRGRHLLAHELSHTVQQQPSSASDRMIQNRGFFENVGIFLGFIEGEFTEDELVTYLEKVTKAKSIEDKYDSDNKARAIVRRWRKAEPKFLLTPEQKELLINEMLKGPTLEKDETAILDLLEFSDNVDLQRMFTSGNLKFSKLESDLNGAAAKRFAAFVAARFKGGKEAILKGNVEVIGKQAKGAPVFTYDWAFLKARIEGDYSVEDIQQTIAGFKGDVHDQALTDISKERTRMQQELTDLRDRHRKEQDAGKKKEIADKANKAHESRVKLDAVLHHMFRDIVLTESKADLVAATTIPTAAEKKAIEEALKPEVTKTKTGKSKDFELKLPGEQKDYEEKMREGIPAMIQRYYDSIVVGHGKKEHDDPTKVHPLKRFEEIGKVSQDETDKLYGSYKKGPELKADVLNSRGRVIRRGNIHDKFVDTEADLRRGGAARRREVARDLMFYFFQTDYWVAELNRDHHASPEFDDKNKPQNDEAKILRKLAREFTRKRADIKRLTEIERGWDATAGEGEINVQIFKKSTPDEDRDWLWEMFQTLIHEYIHTLSHKRYDKYAESFGDQSNQYDTLIEGVDSLLTEIVWSNVEPRVNDKELRKKIEGPIYAKLPPIKVRHPSRLRAASYTQAVRLVNIVGIRNIYVAYFLGEVEKIGGTVK